MKKILFGLLFMAPTMTAQERLINYDIETKTSHSGLLFKLYDGERQRLLVPKYAEFLCQIRPAFYAESSLSYDSVNHELVFVEADTSIWSRVYGATHKHKYDKEQSKKMGMKVYKEVPLKKAKRYKAPKTRQWRLAVSDELANDLVLLIRRAVTTSGERDMRNAILDGCTWEYVIDGHHAQTNKTPSPRLDGTSNVDRLINLTLDLRDAIRSGDRISIEKLHPEINALNQLFSK
ncbi:MAG: hypothetical protein ILA39_00025 [Bacteroidaceae bacterium]|nr:hypothetical protein [Bacteroidaceae bacterium]